MRLEKLSRLGRQFSVAHVVLLSLFAAQFAEARDSRDVVTAAVKVDVGQVARPIDPFFMGMGLHPGERRSIQQDANVANVRDMLGLKSIRFPNGCEADAYDWLHASAKGHITLDEFLDFCDRTSCRPYYTINLQGGTRGLEGPVPQNAAIDERIRYKHTAPNPCGYPATRYHYGTLLETIQLVEKYTVQRILEGRTPILDYEMGNENWGQATTDWSPDVYLRTIEVYAQAMRDALERAKMRHPKLRSVRLRITAVGYPMTGNNQNYQEANHHSINVAWTWGLNRLHERGLIDSVEEHFYPHSLGTGDALIWTEHNLNNVLLARAGKPNPRLNGYVEPELAYEMPMQVTEWNLKCWGEMPRFIKIPNGDFEEALSRWAVEALPPGTGTLEAVSEAARRGGHGLRIQTQRKSLWAEARQILSTAGQSEIYVLVWVRTDSPAKVSLVLRNGRQTISERTATAKNRWHRFTVGGKLANTAAAVEIVLRASGPNVTAWFDDIEVLCYTSAVSRAAVSVNTFEQHLFCVDAIRQMLVHGVQRNFLHHIFGNYACGVVAANGKLKEHAKPFHLYAGRLGREVLKSETQSPTFDYNGRAAPGATDFNALAPDVRRIPCLSALATGDGNQIHLLLLNRSTDRKVKAKISLSAAPDPKADICTLSGEDFNATGAVLAQSSMRIGKTFRREVPPHTAEMVSFKVSRTK